MPTTKEALLRYRIIDACLRNTYKTFPTLQEMVDACSEALGKTFSNSTIQKDIYTMRYDDVLGYNAPIAYCRLNRGYFYTEDNYTISSIPLTDDEINALEFSLSFLKNLPEDGINDHLAGAVDKITRTLSVRRVLREESPEKIIQIEKAPQQKGIDHLEKLIEAIKNHVVVSINYKPFYAKESQIHVVSPYFLKEYRNRWYLIGWQEYNQRISTYALDRFVSFEPANEKKYFKSDFDPVNYYKNTIGITYNSDDPPEITVKFTKEQAPYILTQPIHESQKVLKETKDHLYISLKVHPTYELFAIILGYGDAVEVVKPEYLRDKIKSILTKAVQQYS